MTNFNSLPRELRDQIYSQVLVSTLPIQFSNVLGPMVCDPDLIAPMAILFAWASSQRIADEACEIFYQRNTFLVYCEDLPTFLEGKIHKMLSIDVGPLIHNQGTTFRRSFDTREWVANIDVIIEQNTTNYSRYLAYELQYLLRCPRLRNLTIKTGRNAVMSWEKEWTGVLKELQLKAALSSPPFGEVAMIMKEMSRILEKDLAREAENDATPKYWAFAALLV